MLDKVVLVHGYNRDKYDLLVLRDNLIELGYDALVVNLPLTYKKIEYGTAVFKEKMQQIIADTEPNEKVHIVGHSFGGIVVRLYLAQTEYETKIGRAVLIGTPNRGSKLAGYAVLFSYTFIKIFKALVAIDPQQFQKLDLEAADRFEIGAIAGDKMNLLLGGLLDEVNDGRIEVSSVYYEGLKDFIVIHYGHNEIHYKFETARLVDSFLRTGKFKE